MSTLCLPIAIMKIWNALFVVTLLVSSPTASAAATCKTCGTVTGVRTIEARGEATGAGAIVGGVLGGVLGHQVGGGRGRDVATVAGAAGGAYVGHQTERSMKSATRYRVDVRMDSGKRRTFTYASAPGYRVGDPVTVKSGRMMRR